MLKTADPTIVPVPTSDLAIKTPEIKVHNCEQVLTWPRKPVYKNQAQRQVYRLKIETGYWTKIFKAEFQIRKQNRF
jgi:hypothetical protein